MLCERIGGHFAERMKKAGFIARWRFETGGLF
jgi:hypothetical protein